MARPGTWFQAARGRAMVRTRAMREARFWKRVREYDNSEIRYQFRRKRPNSELLDILYSLDRDQLLRLADIEKQSCVNRARRANKDWRRYREYMAKFD